MNALRAVWRLARVLVLMLAGWATIVFLFPRLDTPQQQARVQTWSRRMLQVLAIGLRVRGSPPVHGPLMLVANHISWLDILVMHAARHCRFVAKADVQRWPLVGRLATGGGTLYIARESSRDAMRVVHHMAASLKDGDILAVFPEGTTSDGVSLLPFHANLLQAAISADAPLQPVGLNFIDAATGRTSLSPCYIDDDTLVGSLWRTLTGPPVIAVVTYGQPQAVQGRSRRSLARELQAAVEDLRRS